MRQDRQKRNYGGALRRTQPSFAARHLDDHRLVPTGARVLDYGSGFGYDAQHFGWTAYDPFYGPHALAPPYDCIVCTQVLNAISAKHRADALAHIQALLAPDGAAYLCVARNLPRAGRTCDLKRRQYYVVLEGAESVYADAKREIYRIGKTTPLADRTVG